MTENLITHDGESYVRLAALYEDEIEPLLMLPFNGATLPAKVRRLNHAQIEECGDFSLLELTGDIASGKNKITPAQMINYAETQYQLLKTALISPSYDELMAINEKDELRVNAESELLEIEKTISSLPNGPKKSKLRGKLDLLTLQCRYLLPSDFVSHVVSFALRIEDTDIKRVSEDMLYKAAILANKGNDNPSDHIHGNFTDFNREDINSRAWIIFSRKQAEVSKKHGRNRRR